MAYLFQDAERHCKRRREGTARSFIVDKSQAGGEEKNSCLGMAAMPGTGTAYTNNFLIAKIKKRQKKAAACENTPTFFHDYRVKRDAMSHRYR